MSSGVMVGYNMQNKYLLLPLVHFINTVMIPYAILSVITEWYIGETTFISKCNICSKEIYKRSKRLLKMTSWKTFFPLCLKATVYITPNTKCSHVGQTNADLGHKWHWEYQWQTWKFQTWFLRIRASNVKTHRLCIWKIHLFLNQTIHLKLFYNQIFINNHRYYLIKSENATRLTYTCIKYKGCYWIRSSPMCSRKK